MFKVAIRISASIKVPARRDEFLELVSHNECCYSLIQAIQPNRDVGGPNMPPNSVNLIVIGRVFVDVACFFDLAYRPIFDFRALDEQSVVSNLSNALLNSFELCSRRVNHFARPS